MSSREGWPEHTSGRERVRIVVETLDEPATIETIAERADVVRELTLREVRRLTAENRVRQRDDGTYESNPVQQFIDQLPQLVENNSKAGLESRLDGHRERIAAFETEYDAESARELRDRLADEDVPAAQLRELRNASDTWRALEMEIRLVKHALQLYDDLSELSQSDEPMPVLV